MKKTFQIMALRQLAHLDVDAIQTYDSALAHIDSAPLRDRLSEFRVDHARHVQDLNEIIERLGGAPVRMQPDLKGLVLQGMTSATSRMGTRAALIAMIGNEQLTTHSYQAALRLEFEPDAREVIERNYSDEQRHLAWIREAARNPLSAARQVDAAAHL